jgi:uncharacterized protein YceH (UPF0502 family)
MDLTFDETRILGVLIEKERSTPDYYPLTVNSLGTGCNQKSNRDPVVDFSESHVMSTLDSLMRRRLVGQVTGAGSRAVKYRHALAEAWELGEAELSALAVLMLRGPQTVGEIRTRTGRLFAFEDLGAVEATLAGLMGLDEPMVTLLPRQPGQKEARYAHLLSGEPDLEALAVAPPVSTPDRLDALETEVVELKESLAALEEAFQRFRAQFT